MAYHTQCSDNDISCRTLLRFSNPRQTWQGDPLGVAFGSDATGVTGPADAAAVLNATGPVVARWRRRPGSDLNRRPTIVGVLPDRRLPAPSSTGAVDVSYAFADPDGDPLSYSVSSSAAHVVRVSAAGARVPLTAVSVGTATIWVTAIDPSGLSVAQSFTVKVAAPFTDDPIAPGVTAIRAVHFTELRLRIDDLRREVGLTPYAWTDRVLTAGVAPVRSVHLPDLRGALAAVYTATGRSVPRWTDVAPAAGATPIRAAHLTELRAAVVALE